MFKKIASLLLVLLLCLCAVSCAKTDDAPEDMKSATVNGEPFILYVPESWNPNTVSGISGAYYSSSLTALVTARYYTPDAPLSIDAYMDLCAAQYAVSREAFAITGRKTSVLGGKEAVRLDYTVTSDGTALTCFQITALYEGDMITLNGYCDSSLYESEAVRADFDKIISEFVFCAKADPNGVEVVDKNTPDGMEIASADHIEYRMYVPKTWVCDAESNVSEAYYPESGRSNVTVTSYAPDTTTTIGEYFAKCEESYKTALSDYERISEAEGTVAGRTAISYTYRVCPDGVDMTIRQTLFIYNEKIYSFTYTALAENFELHLADVDAMLNAFTFR